MAQLMLDTNMILRYILDDTRKWQILPKNRWNSYGIKKTGIRV